jgi:transposase-like protein
MNILEISSKYPTKRACIQYLERIRWGSTPRCPYCDSINSTTRPKEDRHQCNMCNKSFSVTVGTIFQDSNLGLEKWFLAVVLILNAKKGISSRQLARDLGVDKNTAWYLQMRLRRAMEEDDSILTGIVEADETYIGGDLSNKTKKYRVERDKKGLIPGGMEHKHAVVGMLQRSGKVIGKVLNKAHGKTIKPLLKQIIDPGAILITDGFGGYHGLGKYFKEHQLINHSQDEFVRGEYHTNSIEGFWSLLKRGIRGQYHNITLKYLQSYVNELSFRYSNRSDSDLFNTLLVRAVNLTPV